MLDVLRKHSRSFIIYILFGIIIAVFVVNFGPQSAGCATTTSHAGKVKGHLISTKGFHYAWQVWKQAFQFGGRFNIDTLPEAQLVRFRGMAMDQLVARELLADDARKLGIRIPDEEINDMLLKGRFLALGHPQPLVRNDDGKFDYDLFSRYVRYSWGLTVRKFKAEQARELLADKLRQLFRSSIEVSVDEVRKEYAHKNTQVNLEYVRFTPSDFYNEVTITPAKIKTYIKKNKDKIKKHYEDNKSAYQKLPKQARVQAIVIKTDKGQADDKQTSPQPDDKIKAEAKKRAEAALKRIKGGEDFGKVAAALSEDEETKSNQGFLGWRNEDSLGLGSEVQKALAKLKDNQVSGVIEGDKGWTIIKVTARRQGDLTLEQAQEDIAEERLKNEEALALATAKAQEYLERAKAGEKLADIFTSDSSTNETNPSEAAIDDKNDTEGADAKTGGAQGNTAKAVGNKKALSKFKLATTGPFSRSGRDLVPGVGVSKELMDKAFKMKKGDLAQKPYVVDHIVYLVSIKDRTDPDWKEWDKKKVDLIEEAVNKKSTEYIQSYTYDRCKTALENKEIEINPSALITQGYMPPKGEPPLPTYIPCAGLKQYM